MRFKSAPENPGRRRFLRNAAGASALGAGTMLCACGVHGAFAASEVGGGPAVDPGDVLTQIELVNDLASSAERAYAALCFPAFLRDHANKAGKSSWDLHQDYEQLLVSRMHEELLPKWRNVLAGTETHLRDNCWPMLETFAVQRKPEFLKGLGGSELVLSRLAVRM